jgi:hypothetical protein
MSLLDTLFAVPGVLGAAFFYIEIYRPWAHRRAAGRQRRGRVEE